jgi:hypothetical protein
MDADLFAKLESGAEIEEMDAEGRPLALIRFVPRREDDYWRTAELMSPYLPATKCYFDSRKQDYPDFFAPWQRYVEAARAAKEEILSGRKPMPSPSVAKPAARAPAAASMADLYGEMHIRLFPDLLGASRSSDFYGRRS